MPPIFFSTAHLMLRIRSVMAQSFAEGADCPARIRHTAATARGESDQLVAWQPLGTLDDVASRAEVFGRLGQLWAGRLPIHSPTVLIHPTESVASSAEHADVVLVPNARLISERCRHGFAC